MIISKQIQQRLKSCSESAGLTDLLCSLLALSFFPPSFLISKDSLALSAEFLWYCLRMSGCHTGCLLIGQCNTHIYSKQGELVRTSRHLLHSLTFHPINNWAYTRTVCCNLSEILPHLNHLAAQEHHYTHSLHHYLVPVSISTGA